MVNFEREAAASVENADVTIVGGAGHVGIPLALSLASCGLRVNVNDRNEIALAMLQSGQLPFIENGGDVALADALKHRRLTFTVSPDKISTKGPVIVTIGTPVDEFMNPVQRVVQNCIDELLPFLKDGQLLIMRSTVFPGTTEWLSKYLQSRGRDLRVSFCPERIIQGHGLREIREVPQIVSGMTEEAAREAADFFRCIAPEIVFLPPTEAEFAKLFCNAYRYLEFAITNEFYLMAKSADVDYHRILEGMKHNYPRLARIPGPGYAAGPCLFKDTAQLAAFAGNQFGLGHAAMLVNEGLVLRVIELLKKQFDISKMTVGLLGMAFKAECDDIRSSLSYKFKKALAAQCQRVLTTDPFVPASVDPEIIPVEQVLHESDLLVLCTPHVVYKRLDVSQKPVFDLWRHLSATSAFH